MNGDYIGAALMFVAAAWMTVWGFRQEFPEWFRTPRTSNERRRTSNNERESSA